MLWLLRISEFIVSTDACLILNQILPLIRKHKVLHLNRTDTRLANSGLPIEIQKLRCRVNYASLRFTPQIEELGKRVIRILRQNGPFLVLHLRYEMDMLAFSGCTQGCSNEEAEELTRMRWFFLFLNHIFILQWNFSCYFLSVDLTYLLTRHAPNYSWLQVCLSMVERESDWFRLEKKRWPLPIDTGGDCSCPQSIGHR